jgi:hypothetical protein
MRTSRFSELCRFDKLIGRCRVFLKAFTLRSGAVPSAVVSLESIHYCLKEINAGLWRELRNGALSSCYVGLYRVRLDSGAKADDWRELNRQTVSSLNGFSRCENDKERHGFLEEALCRIGEKLLLVRLTLKRKAITPTKAEKYAIQSYEAELYRLSCLLGACH